MSEIICPHCGSPNSIEAENCSVCHKSLYEEPAEPYHPPAGNGLDWLQDYRSFGTEGSFVSDDAAQPEPEGEAEPPMPSEIQPAFLTETNGTADAESDQSPEGGEDSGIPDWLARVRARSREDAQTSQQEPPPPPPEPKYKVGEPIKTDWLRDLTGAEEKPPPEETNAYPDWLKRIAARSQEAKKAKEADESATQGPFDLSSRIASLTGREIPEKEEVSPPFVEPDEKPEQPDETDLFNLYSQELESLAVQPPITPEPVETSTPEAPPDMLPPEPEPSSPVEELPAFITQGLPEEPIPDELEPLEDVKPIPNIDWLDEKYIETPEPEAPTAEEPTGIDWSSDEIEQPAIQPWDALANLERIQAECEEPPEPSVDALINLGGLMGESQESLEESEDTLADLDWLKAQREEQVQPFEEGQTGPDWLSEPEEESSEDVLANLEKLLSERQTPAEEHRDETADLDWLKGQGEAEGHPNEEPFTTPDWLSEPKEETSDDVLADLEKLLSEKQTPFEGSKDETADLDWLKAQGEESLQPFEETPVSPDWFTTSQEKTEEPSVEAEAEKPAQPGEIPEWLFMADETGSAEKTAGQPVERGEEFSIYDEENVPDWLKEGTSAAPTEVAPAAPPARETPEIPDWLKDLSQAEGGEPVKAGYALEEHIEESGPLAGFQGILPGEETVTHYTKPPTYAGTLQVTEKQRIYATMFDTIISSEKKVGEATEKRVTASLQALRLFVGILVIGIMVIALFFDAQIAAPPALYPGENVAFFNSIQSITSTTASSRILVGLDYEPSLSGEVGTTAGVVLQDLMAGNSSLAFVSLNPTGPALAADLVDRANQAVPAYPAAEKMTNLGYLPGGASALAGLAANPVVAAPNTTDGSAAWESGALQGVRSINDFDAVLLLTDNSESARAWIEQIQTSSKDTPFLVVSSAQVVPVLQPYVQSGQITGLLGGLSGAASYQQLAQDSSGGLSAYWDAYQVGMLLAAIFMILGAVVFSSIKLIQKMKKA